ncbi:hypothetical protein RIF29_04706 [Crotalaria pallida]|uniref:Uncharacterized protein n=1 Tax=Crotalaria pallida TaxID=3830 RepID=A0AAN9J1A1_CROPI
MKESYTMKTSKVKALREFKPQFLTGPIGNVFTGLDNLKEVYVFFNFTGKTLAENAELFPTLSKAGPALVFEGKESMLVDISEDPSSFKGWDKVLHSLQVLIAMRASSMSEHQVEPVLNFESILVLSVWFLFDIITVLRSECDKAAVAKVLMYELKHMRDRQGDEKITILSRF